MGGAKTLQDQISRQIGGDFRKIIGEDVPEEPRPRPMMGEDPLMQSHEDLPVNTRRKAVVDVVRQNLSEVERFRQEKSVSAKMKAAHAEQTRKLQERRATALQRKRELERTEIESKIEKERRELEMIQRKRTKQRGASTKSRSPPSESQQIDSLSHAQTSTTAPDRSTLQTTSPSPFGDTPTPTSERVASTVTEDSQIPHPTPDSSLFPSTRGDTEFYSYRVAEADVPSELLEQAHRNIHHKNIARSLGYTMKGLQWNRILHENRSYVRNLCVYLEKQKNNNTHLPS